MVGKNLNLSEVFSDDISYMSDLETLDSLVKIKSVLQYYDGDKKLKYINSKRKELRKKLVKSIYKNTIPLEDIENDLNGSLETYYKKLSISQCTTVEFSNSLTKGKHGRREGKLIVSQLDYVHGDEPNFSFGSLDAFKPLVQYIRWSIWFLELKKLTDELTERRKAEEEEELHENFTQGNKKEVIEISEKLSVKQRALIHVYEGNAITKDNASDYAANYGYVNKNSGFGLYQDYLQFMDHKFRIAEPTNCSRVTMRNKIKFFESVLPNLSEQAREQAIKEIAKLQNKYDELYP